MANIYGASLFLPFGGGVQRARAGALAGVRAASVGGLAGTNLRALLEAADVHAGFRERYGPVLASHLCQKVGNTDNLELGFAIIVRLLPGFAKGEFEQMLKQSARGDFLERLKNDPELSFSMATGSALYDDPELMAEEKADTWNNGANLDPRSKGQTAYTRRKEQTALRGATARDEGVRKNFAGKGLGAGALGA